MKKKSNNTILPTKIKLIIRLVSSIFDCNIKLFLKTFYIMNDLRKSHGLPFMYKYMKASRLHITRYICGKPLNVNDARVSVIDGWPRKFLFLKDYLTSLTGLRIILTAMTFSKAIMPSKKENKLFTVNLDSITDEYKGTTYVIPRFFIDVMRRKYNIKGILEKPSSQNLFLNMKSCPSGISIVASLGETLLLTGDLLMSLLILLGEEGSDFYWRARAYVLDKTRYWPLSDLTWVMVTLRSKLPSEKDFVQPGKLAAILETEGKVRVVAMFDYWTQWALKPIHDDLLHILKRIPMDRTFSQDPFHDWKNDENRFWSLDLSSATDRFPLFVQTKVIKALYGENIGKAWANVLVNRNFTDPSIDSKDEVHRYNTGQPMGAYSSWATFALTHHFVVQWAAYKAGLTDFTDYILLGDDIVIKNDRVAQIYIGLMTKWGVEISQSKTHVSYHTYEFAKRWIHYGEEISPFPVKGASRHFKEPKTVLSLVNEWHLKTHYILGTGLTAYEVVKESYKTLKVNGQWCTELLMTKRLYDYWIGLSYTYKNIFSSELRDYFVLKGWDETTLPNSDQFGEWILRVVDLALSKVVLRVNRKVIELPGKLLKQFMPEVPNKNDISFHPLIHALRNTTRNLNLRLREWDSETQNLSEILDFLTVPGVTEIVHLKRQMRKEVVGIDRLWKSIKVNEVIPTKDPQFFFGSPVVEGFTPKGWTKFLAMRAMSDGILTRSVRDLDTWCSGRIAPPLVELPLYWEIY